MVLSFAPPMCRYNPTQLHILAFAGKVDPKFVSHLRVVICAPFYFKGKLPVESLRQRLEEIQDNKGYLAM